MAPGADPWIQYVWEFKSENNQSQDKSVSEWKTLNVEAYEHRRSQTLFYIKATFEWMFTLQRNSNALLLKPTLISLNLFAFQV